MITGSHFANGDLDSVREKLRLILSGANCEVDWLSDTAANFRHGTYLTQTADMLPKRGSLRLEQQGDQVHIHWTVTAAPFARYWLILVAVVFCWAVFPPFLVHHVLVRVPRRFMNNLLAAL